MQKNKEKEFFFFSWSKTYTLLKRNYLQIMYYVLAVLLTIIMITAKPQKLLLSL